MSSSAHRMWDRGVVATVDVFKGVQRQLLRVRQIRDVQRHSGETEQEEKHR